MSIREEYIEHKEKEYIMDNYQSNNMIDQLKKRQSYVARKAMER